ncbi:hypothetical protein DPMN_059904 [Dreissena polymorpha]|uniref:Uncharacterized protein n=1 Tax=Dreissena polymorpha TaxID=45954 RepID=A0A9D4HHM9_DREPO|nr:hypothetical protein DPMN_059904 [Dreissena polymorpha]
MYDRQKMSTKTAPPPGSHVFFTNRYHFKTQVKYHKKKCSEQVSDLTINITSRVLTRENSPTPVCHVFQQTTTIFKRKQAIIRTNVLTKSHGDRIINVYSRFQTQPILGQNLLTRKTASLLAHMFYIIRTKYIQTKFHEDRNECGL